MSHHTAAIARCHLAVLGARTPARDERGEGVISAAIVVLIMALLGAALWVVLNGIVGDAATRAGDEINRIGG